PLSPQRCRPPAPCRKPPRPPPPPARKPPTAIRKRRPSWPACKPPPLKTLPRRPRPTPPARARSTSTPNPLARQHLSPHHGRGDGYSPPRILRRTNAIRRLDIAIIPVA